MNIPKTKGFRLFLYACTFIIAYIAATIIDKPQYLTMYWIGLIGFLNVELMLYLTKTKYSSFIKNAYTNCYINCKNPFCKYILQFRGDDYFLTFGDEKETRVKTCLLSLWGVLHFILFTIIGLFVPNVFFEVVIVSILYELIEYLLYNCHDALDILLNISGYLLGTYLKSILI